MSHQAIVVTYTNTEVSNQAVERLHQAFPGTPIFVRATDYEQYLSLQDFGATAVVSDLRCDDTVEREKHALFLLLLLLLLLLLKL